MIDHEMAQLAGALLTVDDTAVLDRGTTNARSDGQHHRTPRAEGSTRTGLSNQCHAAIIGKRYRLVESIFDQSLEVALRQVEITARKDGASVRIDPTRDADADGNGVVAIHLTDQIFDDIDRRFAVPTAGDNLLVQDFSGGADAGGTNVCATDVKAYGKVMRFHAGAGPYAALLLPAP